MILFLRGEMQFSLVCYLELFRVPFSVVNIWCAICGAIGGNLLLSSEDLQQVCNFTKAQLNEFQSWKESLETGNKEVKVDMLEV